MRRAIEWCVLVKVNMLFLRVRAQLIEPTNETMKIVQNKYDKCSLLTHRSDDEMTRKIAQRNV